MTRLYAILAVVGWAWFVVVALFLAVKLLSERRMRRAAGFDVVMTEPPTDATSAAAPAPPAANPERGG